MKWPDVGMFFAVNNSPPDFLHPPRRPSCPSWPRRSRCKRTILRRFWSPVFERKKSQNFHNQRDLKLLGRFWESKIFSKILEVFLVGKGRGSPETKKTASYQH